ncbi:MAG: SUMF1/EgtB/PvdO family nonheme iron enzyme [Candidatus Bipolaricaulota bacterium]
MKKSQAMRSLLGILLVLAAACVGHIASAVQEQLEPPEGMILIAASSFMMGDDFAANDDSTPSMHEVKLDAFYMDAVETTKAQWDRVAAWAAENGYDIGPTDASAKAADHPVFGVSWYEAVKWANARSEMEGLTPCYYTDGARKFAYRTGSVDVRIEWVDWAANGYFLPTEAQWEEAARGGCEGHRFPWCDTDEIQQTRANYYSDVFYSYDTSSTRGDHPAYAVGGYPFTAPVGGFDANGYGLYDMAGNVLEWCWDWYEEGLSGGESPRGPATGTHRVDRGGSWYHDASRCPVARRHYLAPDTEHNTLGFRLVKAAP